MSQSKPSTIHNLPVIAVLTVLMLMGMPGSGNADQGRCWVSYLWIEYGPTVKEKDGAVTQRFYIRPGCVAQGRRPAMPLLKLDAACCMTPQPFPRQAQGGKQSRQDRPQAYGRLEIKNDAGIPYVDVTTGTFSVVHIRVTAQDKAVRMRAFTACTLFGGSNRSQERHSSVACVGHALRPAIRLTPAVHHYWMQTGQSYHFTYAGMGPNPTSAVIIDPDNGDGSFKTVSLDPENGLAVTPAHEPALDRAGPRASMEKVLLIREVDGDAQQKMEYRTTYTLNLHRSRYGHRKPAPGMALFFLAAASTAIVTVHARKGGPF